MSSSADPGDRAPQHRPVLTTRGDALAQRGQRDGLLPAQEQQHGHAQRTVQVVQRPRPSNGQRPAQDTAKHLRQQQRQQEVVGHPPRHQPEATPPCARSPVSARSPGRPRASAFAVLHRPPGGIDTRSAMLHMAQRKSCRMFGAKAYSLVVRFTAHQPGTRNGGTSLLIPLERLTEEAREALDRVSSCCSV